VDGNLIDAVDDFIRQHPEADRDMVIDQALRLWYAREQSRAMEVQFADASDVDLQEWQAWRTIRRAAAAQRLDRRAED
jgi:hypothetical protein